MYLQDEGLLGLHIIQKGQVKISFDADLLSFPNIGSLKSEDQKEDDYQHCGCKLSLEKKEGSYFCEWELLGEHFDSVSAVAIGECVCSVLTKEKFDSVIGPLARLSKGEEKYVIISSMKLST